MKPVEFYRFEHVLFIKPVFIHGFWTINLIITFYCFFGVLIHVPQEVLVGDHETGVLVADKEIRVH